MTAGTSNRYSQIIERIFLSHCAEGALEIPFDREDIAIVAREMGITLPQEPGRCGVQFPLQGAPTPGPS